MKVYKKSQAMGPLFLHACFFAFLFALIFNPSFSQIQEKEWLEISKFVDGDTFWVKDSKGQEEKIRLIGIDAPEARRTGKKDIGHYGKEASAYLEKYIGEKRVRLELDVSRYDRYKRTLAYVYLEDGTFLNAHLVKEGYASVMTVPPNVRHADLFLKLQQEARKKKKGLWGMP
jgi:micrococcal nuclease